MQFTVARWLHRNDEGYEPNHALTVYPDHITTGPGDQNARAVFEHRPD
ncbi:MAG: hypothetical protein ABIO83_11290 [Ilumatobacteraceae bacterium]